MSGRPPDSRPRAHATIDPVASKRGKQTVRDMFLSMLVITAVAGVAYIFIPHDEEADPIKAVDYRVELATARRAAPYPVAAPAGLPEGWKATSVSYEGHNGAGWHLGYLDPDRRYVAVEQSTAPAKKYVPVVSQDAKNTGQTRDVAGQEWEVWKGPKYDALVLHAEGVTTVVTGSAPTGRLVEMAAALETAPEPAEDPTAPSASSEPATESSSEPATAPAKAPAAS
ncbi:MULTISPECIES: DUF4245 domain-containing protein [unclassified Streptomyces]|uniref:DUF4245 domain-containing protein n=1 Tax=unclassified Streptomyces TaxID=2593676 RepID=UPI000805E2F3|nr:MULTISPECIES: DUF4245 domain-containing protein [unclassified Streptomyces]SBU90571.1 Protein of unknown function (DUF4245) [Streptomyces sp. OspMP-M45]